MILKYTIDKKHKWINTRIILGLIKMINHRNNYKRIIIIITRIFLLIFFLNTTFNKISSLI